MFAPNPAARIHHRSPTFRHLLRQTIDLFRLKMDISEDYDILLLPGPGSMAVESMIASLRSDLFVLGTGWKFGERMMQMAQRYGRYEKLSNNAVGYVQYETSVAGMTGNNAAYRGLPPALVDGVSAFPYYSMPENCAAYATVSSKQLGAKPNVGIVMVKRDQWGKLFFEDHRQSVLNLSWYRRAYEDKCETPMTPMLMAIESLHWELRHFPDLLTFRQMIDDRREQAVSALGDYCSGRGPSLLVKNVPERLAEQFDLYPAAKGEHQLFLWFSEEDNEEPYEFDQFLKEMKKWKQKTQ